MTFWITLSAAYLASFAIVLAAALCLCRVASWADRALEEHFGRDDRPEGR